MVVMKLKNKVKEMVTKKRPGALKDTVSELAWSAFGIAIVAVALTAIGVLVNNVITSFTTEINSILGI